MRRLVEKNLHDTSFLNVVRLKLSTTAVGGNLHSMQASTEDQLAPIRVVAE